MNSAAQRGFTLIELIIFMVVVSAGLAGILSVVDGVVKSSADPMVRKQAMALADSVMEEILIMDYTLPAGSQPPAVGSTDRSSYKSVDDYNNITEAAFSDLSPALKSYQIKCTVAPPATVSGISLKKVTVTVSRGSVSISLSSYRGDYYGPDYVEPDN